MKVTTIPFPSLNIPFLVMLMMIPPLAVGLEVRPPDTHPGMQAVKPGGSLSRLDGALLKVYLEFVDHQRAAPGAPFRPGNPFLKVAKGRF